MDSDTLPLTLAEIDSMPLSSWWESRGIPRSTAFKLVKVAGIKPGRIRVPSSKLPVSSITPADTEKLDALAARLKDGATLPQLEAEITTSLVAQSAHQQETVSDDLSHQQKYEAGALIQRLEAGERAIRSGLPLTTSEVAWLLMARPGGDRVQRAGVEAIRHGRNCWGLRRSESG
jgi:hypothetical protein